MTHRNVYKKIGYRFAEELQLVAEEKWIVEALSNIKKQRNSLQIERLQLESLKSQLNGTTIKSTLGDENEKKSIIDEVTNISTIDIMQNSKLVANCGSFDVEMRDVFPTENEIHCNSEQLNLLVTNNSYDESRFDNNSVEEDEYTEEDDDDDDDDEEEEDNVLIDINMLMNAVQRG